MLNFKKFTFMGLFHPDCAKCETEVLRLQQENAELVKIIDTQAETILNLTKPKANPVKLSIIFNNNNLNPSTMSLELKSGQSSVGTLVVTDTVTGLPVTGTFTNLVATSDNPGVASVTANADSTITATGVSAGTANVSVSAIFAFTDSLGNPSSQSLSTTEVVTVDAVPVPNPVSLSVSWSTPA